MKARTLAPDEAAPVGNGLMSARFKALGVHLFTATGAVLSMLAMLAAAREEWSLMFLWLVVALIVDGIDGPLARHYHVKTNWPTYDGVLLDLIIDYLTYVFIPAFALFQSGLLPGWTGWCAIIVITYASALYFVDTRMKTKDNSFAGFPACWNMVVIVLFAIEPNFYLMLAIIVALAATMFTNLKFIHPVRTERWRWISLPMALAWIAFAGRAAWLDFAPGDIAPWGLAITSVYLLLAGIAQGLIPERATPRDG
jgi:phosphatidylcholine synthase